MIIEKQTELLLLYSILNDLGPSKKKRILFNGIECDIKKMMERYNELMAEFLEPYTIK